MEGIIYLLSNPAMPGIIKIGKTTKEDVKVRMKELYASGVPLPFECDYAARVRNIDEVEKALHTAFSPNRVNPRREFFEIEAAQAIAIIRLLEMQNVTPLVDREVNLIDPVELEAGKAFAKKRPRMNFEEMGIPIGSELIFSNNAEVALVVSERTVMFRGEVSSLTSATRTALGEGYAYNIAPGPYWSYNGRKLRDIYNDTYSN
jgi:hypothetical protein